ncbi:hypothetical protein [Limnofasciculus baicalensis]|nr:hypothetical protein [Limnofasciculus baicalensis]
MCFTNQQMKPIEENILLSSLTMEIDSIFIQLRKADKIIFNEINCLERSSINRLKSQSLSLVDGKRLKTSIYQMYPHRLLWDEHIIYMLENEGNNLFKLIDEYNEYLNLRQIVQDRQDYTELIQVDNQLAVATRRLGAMFYHLNSHVNLIIVLLGSATIEVEKQQVGVKNGQEYFNNRRIDPCHC